jgi:hypothetical protein
MGKNQESQRLEDDTTSPLPDDLSEPRPVITERRLYIVHSQNDEKGTGLAFNGLAFGSAGGSRRGKGMLDRAQQARLGKLLRGCFSDVEEEPVPDRFVKLLEALEAQERKTLATKTSDSSELSENSATEMREKSGE